MTLVLPNLWLGDINGCYDLDFLQSQKITHVLTALEGPFYTPELVVAQVTHMNVVLQDCGRERISDVFERTTEFIRSALKGGGTIYVHCLMGMSRSPTLVAAYLIMETEMTDVEALDFLQNVRPIVDPNDGFRRALSDLCASKK
jgi:dual specificity phosphatase 12